MSLHEVQTLLVDFADKDYLSYAVFARMLAKFPAKRKHRIKALNECQLPYDPRN